MIQITALVENTSADPRLGAEHGLSLYIETGAHHILFDMGQTALYAANARALGVDLAGVDLAVLSHGHYDHGGGLAHFLAANPGAPVYLSRYAFEPHYHGSTKNIGLEPALAQNLRLRFTGETTPLGDGLTLYACNARPRRHDLGSFGLTTVRDGAFVAEDFRHEQYLLIEQAGKRVLISGCFHKGILDLVEWFRPDVLVGGSTFPSCRWTKRWQAMPVRWTVPARCFTFPQGRASGPERGTARKAQH